MIKNPILPAVEILSNFKVFTKINVEMAVINNPIGWFQIGQENDEVIHHPRQFRNLLCFHHIETH